MASTGGGVLGKVFYFDNEDENFYADSHVTIMRNSKGTNLMKYLYYHFYLRYDEINATMVKGSTNQTELQRNYLLSYELDIPTLAEQRRMVDYLDTKLSEIDRQVSLLTRKRDAYLRLKKSIINHAVTKGLDKNAKMKDSGIEWIGQVPEQWEVKRIKDISNKVFMGKTPVYTFIENDNWIFGQRNNQNYGLDFTDIKYGEGEFFAERKEYEFLKYGDVLLNTLGGGSVGRVGYYDYEGNKKVITDGHVMVIRCKNYSERFLYYYLSTKRRELEQMAVGSTNQSFFNISDILIIHVPCPPLPEQRSIATYLDDKCGKIDTIVANLNKQISRYGDLKRSLIDEVITGKRAV